MSEQNLSNDPTKIRLKRRAERVATAIAEQEREHARRKRHIERQIAIVAALGCENASELVALGRTEEGCSALIRGLINAAEKAESLNEPLTSGLAGWSANPDYQRECWTDVRDILETAERRDATKLGEYLHLLGRCSAEYQTEVWCFIATVIGLPMLPGDDGEPAPTTLPSVPDARINFELWPGGFFLHDQKMKLPGKPLGVLKSLFQARHRCRTFRDLRNEIWGEESLATEQNVKDAIKTLRATLRKAFKKAKGVAPTSDPIPCVSRGQNLAWQLRLDLLQ